MNNFDEIVEAAWGLVHGRREIAPFSLVSTTPIRASWYFNAHAFSEAADDLARSALADWPRRDYLRLPLAYLYRHSIELRLQGLHEQLVGAPFQTHDLRSLWETCRKALLTAAIMDDGGSFDMELSNTVDQFSSHDPRSSEFRYPPVRAESPDVDLRELVYLAHVFEIAFDALREIIHRSG